MGRGSGHRTLPCIQTNSFIRSRYERPNREALGKLIAVYEPHPQARSAAPQQPRTVVSYVAFTSNALRWVLRRTSAYDRPIKEKSQLLVPSNLQRQAGFKLGDQVELRVRRGLIRIVPKAEQPSPFRVALQATQDEARKHGMDKMTLKQINAEIAAHRKEKRAKSVKQPSK